MLASNVVLAKANAPSKPFPPVKASTSSTLMSASSAALAPAPALWMLPSRRSNHLTNENLRKEPALCGFFALGDKMSRKNRGWHSSTTNLQKSKRQRGDAFKIDAL
jgi:hypothetical protein